MCLTCEISSIVQLSTLITDMGVIKQLKQFYKTPTPLISLVSYHCLMSVCDVKLNQEYSRSTPFLTLPGNILQDQTLRKSHRLRKRKNGERKKCNVFLSGARMNFTNQIFFYRGWRAFFNTNRHCGALTSNRHTNLSTCGHARPSPRKSHLSKNKETFNIDFKQINRSLSGEM